jgi:hypothetical protein
VDEIRRPQTHTVSAEATIDRVACQITKMAGYSNTPLAKKLGIKEGHKVAVVDPPETFEKTLGDLPKAATIQVGLSGKSLVDVIVLFVTSRAQLKRQLATARRRMTPAAGLWVAWPKKASGVATDVTENIVREIALPTGLVDNKVCAIDDTWSGLRLVIRLALR